MAGTYGLLATSSTTEGKVRCSHGDWDPTGAPGPIRRQVQGTACACRAGRHGVMAEAQPPWTPFLRPLQAAPQGWCVPALLGGSALVRPTHQHAPLRHPPPVPRGLWAQAGGVEPYVSASLGRRNKNHTQGSSSVLRRFSRLRVSDQGPANSVCVSSLLTPSNPHHP